MNYSVLFLYFVSLKVFNALINTGRQAGIQVQSISPNGEKKNEKKYNFVQGKVYQGKLLFLLQFK